LRQDRCHLLQGESDSCSCLERVGSTESVRDDHPLGKRLRNSLFAYKLTGTHKTVIFRLKHLLLLSMK